MNKIGDFIHGVSGFRGFGVLDSMENKGVFDTHNFSWKNLKWSVFFMLGLILMMNGVLGANNPSSNWQAQQPTFDNLYAGDFENYWPILNDMQNDQCNATTDFVIGIPPGGCSPSVVRSDLLAEQNVPVFCELYAIKVNPLIKVSSIKSISFKGDYPEGVRSVVYHPARAAVKSYSTLLGSPTLENIGYVVIILKQEKVEADMEEWVAGNLTATMTYDAEEAYGTGRGEYYLEPSSEEDWQRNYMASSFWNGRGYLRVLDVSDGSAKIQVMRDRDTVLRTLTLKEGETSSSSYLPGFYCKAGLKVKLTDITTQEDMARLNIGGESIWVRQGSKFLDGKCSVSRLEVRGNNDGEIVIKCSGAGTISPLSLSGAGVWLSAKSEEEMKKYKIGEKVDGGKFVLYYGEYPEKGNAESKEFVILVTSLPKESKSREIRALLESSASFEKFEEGVVAMKLSGFEILDKDSDFFDGMVKTLEDGKKYPYFDDSVDVVVDELIEYYGSEEKEIGGTWGEEALYEEIVLAGQLGKFKMQKNLTDLFLDEYPLATTADYVRDMRAKLDGTDYSKSFVSVYVGDEFKSISVVDFKPVGEGEKTVDLRVGSQPKPGLEEMEKDDFNEDNGVILKDIGRIEVKDISPGKVRVYFRKDKDNEDKSLRSEYFWIEEGKSEVIAGIRVYVDRVNVKQVAHVSLIPDVKHEKSEADFTFRIGIEKRAIELSPEKTKRMIDNLNKSIEKWEGIVERLGGVVEGLKGACFATSAVLMIKSMVTGTGGEAMARTKVMKKYKEICSTDPLYRGMTSTECYNKLNEDGAIDRSVEAMTGVLNGVNVAMEKTQEAHTSDSGGIFGSEGIDDHDAYNEDLNKLIGDEKIKVEVGGKELYVTPEELSTSQVRAVLTWQEAEKTGDDSVIAAAQADVDAALRNTALFEEADSARAAYAASLEERGVSGAKFQTHVSKDATVLRWDRQTENEGKTNIQYFGYNGKEYKLILEDGVGSGSMGIKEARTCDANCGVPSSWSNQLIPDAKDDLTKEFSKIVFTGSGDSKDCTHPWPQGKAEVSYYEAGDNKGLPAIVPFDLKGGWYVMVSNSGGTYIDDSPQGYTASAEARHFKICNIGGNSLMQSGTGDDLCQTFNVNSAGSVDDFLPCPGLNAKEVSSLYSKAQDAIRQAARQYGEKSVDIFGDMVKVGAPMAQIGGFECQDFMSTGDCKILFNVCDPVICPPSRCDFGGKFPVSDVIGSGIIGSLVLCLPNAKEGVLMPICLSGVHAGLDSYVSILRSEKDCLQHSLDTGEMVGICDQITSIYKCEFFWRQLSPLMDQLIPGIIDYAINGGRVRGGGEYALVQQSWNTMKQSASYFKNVYAQNAFRAFDIRSTQEIGSEVCKAFVGTSMPGSANFIDNLLKPESPSQFYAQLNEMPFSGATVPATSQYKVYYHIYAGNDQGVQYKVYLKDPPASSYYASNPEISVKSGYIAAGSSADESIDFTAPAGYKELCVVINAQEECGFKSVTSSFGIDYLSKKYVEEQATQEDIKTEKECISGTPSALSMANLNLQAGAEESINPEIALRGIVRICASENPDAGVVSQDWISCSSNESCGTGFYCGVSKYCESKSEAGLMQKSGSKWKDVGYCGDVNLRCWLDVKSVADDLGAIAALEGTTFDELDRMKGLINSTRLDLEGVAVLLGKARQDISELGIRALEDRREKGLEIVGELRRVSGSDNATGAGTNGDRAEALALEASVWRLLAGLGVEDGVEPPTVGSRKFVVGSGEDFVDVSAVGSEGENYGDGYSWDFLVDENLAIEEDGKKKIIVDEEFVDIDTYDIDYGEAISYEGRHYVLRTENDEMYFDFVKGGSLGSCESYCEEEGFGYSFVDNVNGNDCIKETDGIFYDYVEDGCCCYNEDSAWWDFTDWFSGEEEKDCKATCNGFSGYNNEGVNAANAQDCSAFGGHYLSECCCFLEDVVEEKSLSDILKDNDWEECEKYVKNIKDYSDDIDDWRRVLAVMIQESNCEYDAVSDAGSYGLMQITKGSYDSICKDDIGLEFDQVDNEFGRTSENIECGIKILKRKYRDYNSGVFESWAWKTAPSDGGFSDNVRICFSGDSFQPKYGGYREWEAAERAYNGWGCGVNADVDYVEKVEKILKELKGTS